MPGQVQSSEYLAFASFTFAANTYYIGTTTELRSGNWYDGVIQSAPQLGMSFGDELALVQAANVDLTIADSATGTYRALAAGNILDGTQVTVSLVMRQHWSDGTTTEQVYAQILTIVGVTMQPQQVILHLQDIEEQKLQALYPQNTWQSTDWPELSSDDAGKPICEPVGTALKLPAVLLRSDAANSEYWYGVCTGTPKLIGISSVNSGTKTITLASAPLYALAAGHVLIITGSSAADGRYTVASASGSTIVVNEPLPTSTGGNVRLMPQVLTVYRNKRVVGNGEYLVQQCYTPSPLHAFNFPSGTLTANLTAKATGTSSYAIATNNMSINGTGGGNYSELDYQPPKIIGGYFAMLIELNAGDDCRIFCQWDSSGITSLRVPANKKSLFFIRSPDASVMGQTLDYIAVTPWNNTGNCSIKNIGVFQLPLTILKFSQPQIDFNGSNYVIECDCAGVESQNASTEIKRLLTNAGAAADATTFTAAAGAGFAQLVDCDYGRGGQRRIDAILDDLLPVARAGLSRNAAGAYTIWQDKAGAVSLTFDESLGDPVNVTKFESTSQPLTVGLNYAPSSADSSQMQVMMTRPVTGGILGAETPREIRYLRDAATADALLCYRALRRWRNRKATANLYGQQVNIGDKIALTSPRNWPGQKTFTVWDVQRIASGNALTLLEYDAAVYTYTAGTLPPTAPTGYQPDYSFTPPLAPSALKVMATAAVVANDGTTTSNATVQATPPTVNWSQIWFAAIHNVTGEIALASGASIGGGNYGATIGNLRPGEVYRLQCYAVNSNNLQGVVQSTFNATAIGGGAGVTTFTTAGLATAPATVASCTAAQALGSNIIVSWPAVSGTNIAKYVLERSYGGGAFAQVYAGLTTAFTESNVNYNQSYQYRVRAQDTYGNFSAAYATSGPVTPTGNVYGGSGGDIGSTTVATVNRTNTTTVSASYSMGVGYDNISITHSLGRVPLCSGVATNEPFAQPICAGLQVATTSSLGINIISFAGNTQNSTVNAFGVPHYHTILGSGITGTASVDIW